MATHEIKRQCTVAVAGQVATFTPITGILTLHDLVISAATVTLAANAANYFNDKDEYEIIVRRRSRTS